MSPYGLEYDAKIKLNVCFKSASGACLFLSLCAPTQIHVFKARPGDHSHQLGVVIRQTYGQRLRVKLLRPPSALHSDYGDEMVRKRHVKT